MVAHYEGCTFEGNGKEVIHLSKLIDINGTSNITLKRRLKLNNCGCVVELTAVDKLWKSFKYCKSCCVNQLPVWSIVVVVARTHNKYLLCALGSSSSSIVYNNRHIGALCVVL